MCLLKQYLFIKLNVTEEQRNFFSCTKIMLFIADTEIGDVTSPVYQQAAHFNGGNWHKVDFKFT